MPVITSTRKVMMRPVRPLPAYSPRKPAVIKPIGTEMTAAPSVIRRVPTIACRMPPPGPMTLRIVPVRKSTLSAGSPLLSTVQISDASGSIESRKADHTSVVIRRSLAARPFSTARDQPVRSAVWARKVRKTNEKTPQPVSRQSTPDRAAAATSDMTGASRGRRGWLSGTLRRCGWVSGVGSVVVVRSGISGLHLSARDDGACSEVHGERDDEEHQPAGVQHVDLLPGRLGELQGDVGRNGRRVGAPDQVEGHEAPGRRNIRAPQGPADRAAEPGHAGGDD